jgi:hypothetical protein
MGDPVDPLFADREVFADFLTRYYTDWEPESALVAEAEGRVVGYLTGCTRYRRYPLIQGLLLTAVVLPKVLRRLCAGRYGPQSKRFLRWFLFNAARETPRAPSRAAHFHINILPKWRAREVGRRLISGFVRALAERNVKRVYGQIQTYRDRRPAKVFERYGFKLFDEKRVSKFEPFGREGVYVSTFVQELET